MTNINKINDCLLSLAKLYEEDKLFNDAIFCYHKISKSILNTSPQIIFLNSCIARCFMLKGDFDNSIKYYLEIYDIDPNIPDILVNIATCKIHQKKISDSLFFLKKVLSIRENSDILKMIGEVYYYLKDYQESIYYYKKSNDKYALSFSILATKNFEDGFKYYENRLLDNGTCHQTGLPLRQHINLPDWDGKIPCKKLLVIYEQGIGDNIMYFRFLIQLAKKFPDIKITYFCKKIVSHFLYSHLDNLIINDDANFEIPSFDFKCFIMSIPHILNITSISPNKLHYIKVYEKHITKWKNILNKSKPLVGFFYKGLLKSSIDKNIDINILNNLFNLDIDFVCLHKKDEIEKDIPFFSKNIKTFDIDNNKAFEDTISILKNIDLLITIDSSIVHLAGAMDIPTYLLLGPISEWRWFNNNEKVWYNSVNVLHNDNKEDIYSISKIKKIIKNMFNV